MQRTHCISPCLRVQDLVDPASALEQLQALGIAVSVTAVTSTRLDFESRRLPDSLIRASVHYYNTEQVWCCPVRGDCGCKNC